MEEVDFKDLTVSFKLDPDFNRTDAANAHLFKVAQQLGMKVKNAILDDSAAQIGTYNRRNQFYLEGSGETAKKMLDYLKTQSMEQQRLMSSPQATEQERQAAAELLNFEVEVSRGGELLGRAGNHGYTSIPDGQSPQQFVESLVFGPAREKGLQSALERIEQNFRQTCAEPNADDLAILQVFKDSAAKKFAADFKAEHSLKGYAAARPQQRITHEYVLGAAEHNYYLRLDSAQAQRFPQEAKLLEKLLQNVGAQRDYFDFNGKSLDPNGQIFALTTAQTEKFKDLLAKSALSAQRLNQLTALYAGQELNYSPACRLDAGKFLRTGKCTVSCLERADFDLTAELGLKQEPKLQDVAVCVTKVENQELSEQLGIDQQKPQPVVLTGQQAAEFAQKAYSAGQQLVKKQAQTETRIEQKTDELAKARAQIEKLNNELMKLKEQNSTLAGLNAQAAELLTAQKKDALKQYESFGQEIKELKEQLQHLDQKLEFSVQLPAVRKSTPLVAVSLGAAAKGCKHAGQFFGHLMHSALRQAKLGAKQLGHKAEAAFWSIGIGEFAVINGAAQAANKVLRIDKAAAVTRDYYDAYKYLTHEASAKAEDLAMERKLPMQFKPDDVVIMALSANQELAAQQKQLLKQAGGRYWSAKGVYLVPKSNLAHAEPKQFEKIPCFASLSALRKGPAGLMTPKERAAVIGTALQPQQLPQQQKPQTKTHSAHR